MHILCFRDLGRTFCAEIEMKPHKWVVSLLLPWNKISVSLLWCNSSLYFVLNLVLGRQSKCFSFFLCHATSSYVFPLNIYCMSFHIWIKKVHIQHISNIWLRLFDLLIKTHVFVCLPVCVDVGAHINRIIRKNWSINLLTNASLLFN